MKKLVLVVIALACSLMAGCTSKQKQREDAYAVALNTVHTQMLTGAVVSEQACNVTSQVWHNAIYDKNNVDTLKFMKDANGDGEIDFNDALTNLYANESMITLTDLIEENKREVNLTMAELSDPPEKFATCYATISDLYKSYTKFTSFAMSPKGSYNDYNSTFSQLDGEFSSTYDLAKTQLPDISNINVSK